MPRNTSRARCNDVEGHIHVCDLKSHASGKIRPGHGTEDQLHLGARGTRATQNQDEQQTHARPQTRAEKVLGKERIH